MQQISQAILFLVSATLLFAGCNESAEQKVKQNSTQSESSKFDQNTPTGVVCLVLEELQKEEPSKKAIRDLFTEPLKQRIAEKKELFSEWLAVWKKIAGSKDLGEVSQAEVHYGNSKKVDAQVDDIKVFKVGNKWFWGEE